MKTIDERLASVFALTFGHGDITDETSILTWPEWDSLGHITLVIALEQEFGVSVSPTESIDLTSVPDIRRFLAARGQASPAGPGPAHP